MSLIEKVVLTDSIVYDFLMSLERLNNNEKFRSAYDKPGIKNKFYPSPELVAWINETLQELPEDIKELMDKYFHWETSFGLCLALNIVRHDIKSVEEFINFIRNMSEKELLQHFICSGFGPIIEKDEKVESFEKLIEELIDDQEKMLMFISKNLLFPVEQKAVVLEFFSDPSKAKQDYLYLLEWYYEHIFKPIEDKVKKSNQNYLRFLEGYLNDYGEEYLKKLVLSQEFAMKAEKIVLGVSYFYGLSSLSSINDDMVMSINGYDRIHKAAEKKDDTLSCVSLLFKSLGNEIRIQILKAAVKEKIDVSDLGRTLKLSNSEISHHIWYLIESDLIKIEKADKRLMVSSDVNTIKASVEKALEKLINTLG
ncbi:ArsR family transcriptional regulator [Kosmotoga olearia]|uniref:Transcriptional regulator, ArsR family n=1 Tax=Kosmotoga olearia (strain ATCC BAA-1733 / DSM 21960 / TBF 19.5.1) TaxID=521045 RepID=C5CHH2_KOSOT|nr:ArsR family transcriptional regulator [Kosmotoga olearia]ACR79727.1 putative transcriptional regulator, ArsR family [Kosmotoga olearia TBF 19.5.1]